MREFDEASWKYYDWLTVLQDAGIKDVQDLEGQYLLKCPFHEDYLPSFRIRLREHNYHCFSCNAFGSVANLMWKLQGSSMSQSQYYEQLLKANPAMQQFLGFNSLFIDSKSLDPALFGRRKFSAKNHLGATMPLSVLGDKMRSISNTWEGLVYSFTLLQEGENPDELLAKAKKVFSGDSSQVVAEEEKLSLSDIALLEGIDEPGEVGTLGEVQRLSLASLVLEEGEDDG